MRLMSAALILSLAACAPASAPASDPAPAEPATPAAVEPAPAPAPTPDIGPVAGGYAPASLDDEGVKAALAVATDAIYTRNPTRALVEKTEAQVQVVAGLNYAFDITMTGGAHYKIVVYKPLGDAKPEVTSFEKVG